jgi:small-conductance mechanosensitive channel
MGDSKTPVPRDLRVTPPPRLNRPPSGGSKVSDIDVDSLNRSLEKMASTINRSARHTEQIPDIKKKVEETTRNVVELNVEMRGVSDRVSKVEEKVEKGHECAQVEVISEIKSDQRDTSRKIETDIQHGVKQEAEIKSLKKESASLETDVEEIKKAPRRMFFSLLGMVFTVLTGAGGAIWFLAELSKDVEFERTQRVEQSKRMFDAIKAVGTKADPTPITQEINQLEKTIQVSNGHEQEYNLLCADAPPYEKRVIRKSLRRRGKRIPSSCLE